MKKFIEKRASSTECPDNKSAAKLNISKAELRKLCDTTQIYQSKIEDRKATEATQPKKNQKVTETNKTCSSQSEELEKIDERFCLNVFFFKTSTFEL